MNRFARDMTDEELLSVVQSIDRVSKPLAQRFEGDDEPIVNLIDRLGLKQDIATKMLINGEVMRECLHRGLHIPRPNEQPSNSDIGGMKA